MPTVAYSAQQDTQTFYCNKQFAVEEMLRLILLTYRSEWKELVRCLNLFYLIHLFLGKSELLILVLFGILFYLLI